MPRKSQKIEKKPMEIVLRKPARTSPGPLPKEKPVFAVNTPNIKATTEVKQPTPLATYKMAGNVDRLMVKTAHIKLPVATSTTTVSKQLEVNQTRQIRGTGDVSTKKENANTKPPNEASMLVSSKRSLSPLPPSFVEAYKKKMKMDAKPSDAKLPVAIATSNQSQGKSFKRTVLDLTQNKENAKRNENPTVVKGGMARVPLSQNQGQGQGPASKPASSIVSIFKVAPREPVEMSARGMLGPSGNDKCYLEQFYKFYGEYKEYNGRLAKHLLLLETSVNQQEHENRALRSQIVILKDDVKNFKNKLSLGVQLNNELNDRYLDTLKTRNGVEKSYQNDLQKANSHIETQKAELDAKQLEINQLRAAMKNMQETNRVMTSVLSDRQMKLKNAEEKVSELLNQNHKQAEELGKQKVQIEDAVGAREVLQSRASQLEFELQQKTLEYNELKEREVSFEEVQLQYEELENQLEALHIEKETIQSVLNDRIQDLEAGRNMLIEFNEEYSKEAVDLKAEKESLNENIAILRATIIKQGNDLKELTECHDQLQGANLQQLDQHGAEIEEFKAQNKKLEEIIKGFENKLQVQAQSLIAEQENLMKETYKAEALKLEFEGERERYQADIDALKTALEHRDKESSAELAKMQSLEAELKELKKINAGLKEENKQKANEISAAKKQFDEEIKSLSNSLRNKIFGLQEDLKQKDIKLIGVEHEKNGIIKQLKNKISSICTTIEQPIIASAIPKSPEPEMQPSLRRLPRKSQEIKPNVIKTPPRSSQKRKAKKVDNINTKSQEVKPNVAKSPPSTSKKRKATKIDNIINESDFESEDDNQSLKLLFAKRENLAVVKPQEDLFDALKNGTT